MQNEYNLVTFARLMGAGVFLHLQKKMILVRIWVSSCRCNLMVHD